jgi:hypothetical protein
MQTEASSKSVSEALPSNPSGHVALRKTNGPWSLREKNLLFHAGVSVSASSREPDCIVIMGKPRNGSIAKTVGHENFTLNRELPAWFRRPVPMTAS